MGIKIGLGILALLFGCNASCSSNKLNQEAKQIFQEIKTDCKDKYHIIQTNLGQYIILPKEDALICIKFGEDNYYSNYKTDFNLEKIICKDNQKGSTCLFKLNHSYIRKEINPSNIKIESKGLEKFLKAENHLEINNPLIKEAVKDAIKDLSEEDKQNPYFVSKAINHWIYNNIEYFALPPKLIERVAKTIDSLPLEDKDDVYFIMDKTFNYDILKKELNLKISKERWDENLLLVTENIFIPEAKESKEIAKEILKLFDEKWEILQLSWNSKDMTAVKVLETKLGKCVNMSYLLVAMARSYGIPAKTIHSKAYLNKNLGGHAWAAFYIPEYGWKELDPTWNEFETFNYKEHVYDFIFNSNMEATLISKESCSNQELLNECKALLDD